MNISRRTILKSAAIGAATAIGSAVTRAPALAESDTVKVASLHDLSGAVDVYGVPSHMCMKVAIDEINAAGDAMGQTVGEMAPSSLEATRRWSIPCQNSTT